MRAGMGLPALPGTKGIAKRMRQAEKGRMLSELSRQAAARIPSESFAVTSRAPLSVGVPQPIESNIEVPAEVSEVMPVEMMSVSSDELALPPTPDEYEQYAEESPLGQAPKVQRLGVELDAERDEQVKAMQQEDQLLQAANAVQNDVVNARSGQAAMTMFRKDRLRRRLVNPW
jgi:hypothetical protein